MVTSTFFRAIVQSVWGVYVPLPSPSKTTVFRSGLSSAGPKPDREHGGPDMLAKGSLFNVRAKIMSFTAIRPALLMIVLTFLLGWTSRAYSGDPSPIYFVDLTDYSGGPVLTWLNGKGFSPEQDIKDQRRIALTGSDQKLTLEAKARSLGLLVNEVDIAGSSRIRIEWGVEAFPSGASYEQGVRSDAVMVYVFFGSQKLSSGSFLIPDSPYFLGLFLCESDRIAYPYVGRYFKLGGRYVCVDRATPGKAVTTDFALGDAFLRFFDRDEILPISGIAIGVDTKSAKGNGSAKAFVKRIEFLR